VNPAKLESPDRRAFLGTLAALLLDRRGDAQVRSGIIDVHHHFYPPSFVAALIKGNQNLTAAKEWTLQHSLDDMDKGGVATALLSITTPGVSFLAGDAARGLARECNEYASKLVTDNPGRFGSFAMLPWPDAQASLREIEYSLDTLKADGIGMLTSYGDEWFGDPSFAAIFEELNRRKAVLYTHPTSANCCRNALSGIPDNAIEYGTDTSRAIVRTLFSGTAQKYPRIRFIFSHAGGTMPFVIERLLLLAKTPQYAALFPQGYTAEAAKLYYDTAQASNPVAMGALRKLVPVSQIVFGTDYPFRTSLDHVKNLKQCGVFNAAELRAIEQGNIRKMLNKV
jgi:predicted TIM-barrel fold metal-dependent hydrolase